MARATAALAAGIGVGAGLMYVLDPDRGSRRRTSLRNQLLHTSRTVRQRVRAFRSAGEAVDDRVVAERARDILDRVVSHAHALALDVTRGVLTVNGPIGRNEVRLALKALKRVPGVRRVVNHLQPRPMSSGGSTRRVAATLAGVAGLGMAARAAMQARDHEFELQS